MNKFILGGVLVVSILIIGVLVSKQGTTPTQPEEVAAPTQGTEAPAPMPGEIQEFTISGRPFLFSLKEIRVQKEDTVRVTFINEQGIHDWRVDEFGAATAILQQGQQETVEFVANQAGEFEYYCSIGDHRARGMVGKLIVEE